MSREHHIIRKDIALRNLVNIARLMAIKLDPEIPGHAELLQAFERAMGQLRKEASSCKS